MPGGLQLARINASLEAARGREGEIMVHSGQDSWAVKNEKMQKEAISGVSLV